MAVILHYFTDFHIFEANNVKRLKLDIYCRRQKCSARNLVFGNIRLITSVKDVMSPCLSVRLCVRSQLYVKTTERMFMKFLPQMYHVDKEELIKFWKSSASGSGSGSRNLKKDYSRLRRDTAFSHNLAHICRQSDRISIKILPQMYLGTRKSP